MRRIGKIVFSRLTVFSLMAALELALAVALILRLSSFSIYFLIALIIANILSIIAVVNKDGNPEYKLTWICVIVLIPFLGTVLYLLYGRGYVTRGKSRIIADVRRELDCQRAGACAISDLRARSPIASGRAAAIKNIDDIARVYSGTESQYFTSGKEMYQSMLKDLGRAEKYIFLEYFIIELGEMWQGIYKVLKQKAEMGVEVRIIYDDVGCITSLTRGFDKQLASDGIKTLRFSKITPSLRYMRRNNNRDHRKLLIIDGAVVYTGGINIGDEYIGLDMRLGVWRDSGVRVSGKAAEGFSAQFLELWCTAAREVPNLAPYFNTGGTALGDGGYYLPFGSGPQPLYNKNASKRAVIDIISGAVDYVYILTPYLIIDFDLTEALLGAAMRGVDVRIITPGIPDKPIIKLLTRGSYHSLLSGGVKIYEYTPGFLHAKGLVADDLYAIAGTVNLDYRSLVHHYEDALWMYSSKTVFDIKKDFLDIQGLSSAQALSSCKTGIISGVIRSLARLFAPLF